jgi:hypothetical protein
MTRLLRGAALVLVMNAAACGGASDFEDSPGGPATTTTTTVLATPATTAGPVTTAGRTCSSILNDGLTLARNFQMESRGVAGPPDDARFRASAQALVDEAKRLGCPIPEAVKQFLA